MVRIFPFGKIFNYSHIEPFLIKLTSFVVINAGVAGCCTGLALSFPGNNLTFTICISFHSVIYPLSSLGEKGRDHMFTGLHFPRYLASLFD